MKKKKSLNSKFGKILAKHIKDLNENSKEIDSILAALLKRKVDKKYAKYSKDLMILQKSTDEIDDFLDNIGKR